ncbi:MAG TPA: hypothetical protein VIY29_24565, partial [Ktedonobacteraceae bacterium]
MISHHLRPLAIHPPASTPQLTITVYSRVDPRGQPWRGGAVNLGMGWSWGYLGAGRGLGAERPT